MISKIYFLNRKSFSQKSASLIKEILIQKLKIGDYFRKGKNGMR